MGIERRVNRKDTDGSAGCCPHGRVGVAFGAGRLLVVSPVSACNVDVVYTHGRPDQTYSVATTGTHHVIACHERAVAYLPTQHDYKVMDEGDLCCMLAFVDAAIYPPKSRPLENMNICVQPVPGDSIESASALSHWLTLEAMQGEAHNALLHHLRGQESYALASYLMQRPVDGAHLNELCVTYGLSYSHFRRLCRRSLGSAIKSRLRNWRAARTVLDIIDSNQSILQIAVGNGYTSASHVSTDIKQLFGFTPRMARNARDLLP